MNSVNLYVFEYNPSPSHKNMIKPLFYLFHKGCYRDAATPDHINFPGRTAINERINLATDTEECENDEECENEK